LAPLGVARQSPDAFLLDLSGIAPGQIAQLLHDQAADYDRPSLTLSEVLGRLSRHAPRFASHWQSQLGRQVSPAPHALTGTNQCTYNRGIAL
jgi:hypothetical protein